MNYVLFYANSAMIIGIKQHIIIHSDFMKELFFIQAWVL